MKQLRYVATSFLASIIITLSLSAMELAKSGKPPAGAVAKGATPVQASTQGAITYTQAAQIAFKITQENVTDKSQQGSPLKSKIEELARMISETKKVLEGKNAEIKKLKAKIEELEQQIKELLNRPRPQPVVITDTKQIDELKAEIVRLKLLVATLEQEAVILKDDIKKLKNENKTKTDRITELERLIAEKDRSLKEWEAIPEAYEKWSTSMGSQNADLGVALKRVMPDLEKALVEYHKKGLIPAPEAYANYKSPKALQFLFFFSLELARQLAPAANDSAEAEQLAEAEIKAQKPAATVNPQEPVTTVNTPPVMT